MSENIPENHTPNILVVDDNTQNLNLLGILLEKKGYEVTFALNGMDALQYLEDDMCDLILLDVMMPGMDGYEVCRQLKMNSVTKSIPVIFLTARNEPDQITRGFAEGAVDYVTKPFNSYELTARIQTHLQQKQLESELRDSLVFSQAIESAIPLGIVVYKSSGQCCFVNRAAPEITGATTEHMMRQDFHGIESWQRSDLLELAERSLAENVQLQTVTHMTTSSGKGFGWIAGLSRLCRVGNFS